MHPFAYVLALAFWLMSMSVSMLNESAKNAVTSRQEMLAGSLRAYGNSIGAYAKANASFSGSASDSSASVPSWLNRPASMSNVILSGTSYSFVSVNSRAEGLAIAARCGVAVTCGVSVNGQIVVPGQASSYGPTPTGVPSNNAVVLIY
ncbi:type IV pilus biogenesis protein PilM [Xanthomonas citri]|uniref:type IV pilus biogenesis protein PilM n=1 Tax=Xanthomonas citri TaxID=346 RepID=UPI000CCE9E9A|nr:type IV pilus biogenesis protein PilM [Xanthomonas citri]PNV26798.1 hypothetical protein xavtCFBP7764_21580 [Xanthomonas citri]